MDSDDSENYFKGKDGASSLKCIASQTERTIYIYGLAEEIDVSEKGEDDNELPIVIDISGFTAPSADWDSTNYTWIIEIL